MDFKSHLPFLQNLWEELVFDLVTGAFENADFISGIRLLDKSSAGRENFFRIEVWTKFSDKQKPLVQEMQSHIESTYIKKMYEDASTSNNKAKDS